jgi:hypothetical protein
MVPTSEGMLHVLYCHLVCPVNPKNPAISQGHPADLRREAGRSSVTPPELDSLALVRSKGGRYQVAPTEN